MLIVAIKARGSSDDIHVDDKEPASWISGKAPWWVNAAMYFGAPTVGLCVFCWWFAAFVYKPMSDRQDSREKSEQARQEATDKQTKAMMESLMESHSRQADGIEEMAKEMKAMRIEMMRDSTETRNIAQQTLTAIEKIRSEGIRTKAME